MSEAVISTQWWQRLCVGKQRKTGGSLKKGTWEDELCLLILYPN